MPVELLSLSGNSLADWTFEMKLCCRAAQQQIKQPYVVHFPGVVLLKLLAILLLYINFVQLRAVSQ